MKLTLEDIEPEDFGRFARMLAPKRKRRVKPSRHLADIHTILMTTTAYDAAMNHLAWAGREEAGLLLGPRDHHLVSHFEPDLVGEGTPGMFTISARTLNETLAKYREAKCTAFGLIHAHPPKCRSLSRGDLAYVKKLLANPKNASDRILVPIVVDGEMIPYIIFGDDPGTVHKGRLQLI